MSDPALKMKNNLNFYPLHSLFCLHSEILRFTAMFSCLQLCWSHRIQS